MPTQRNPARRAWRWRRAPAESVIGRDDVRQEQALEDLLGRPRRPAAWVEADLYRRLYGKVQGRGTRFGGYLSEHPGAERRLACRDAALDAVDFPQDGLVSRARRMALALPAEQRAVIATALELLLLPSEERVLRWVELHPDVDVPHRVIAEECGVARETVTRALSKRRKRCEA